MRIHRDLTINRSEEENFKPRRISAGVYQPSFPVYFLDRYPQMRDSRPWYHLRYHSAAVTDEGNYETLHLLTTERYAETTYFLPHEGQTFEDGFPKIFAICHETSDSQWFPQNLDEVADVEAAIRRINRKFVPSSWTRLDFLTKRPLDVEYYQDGADMVRFDLTQLAFTPVERRETKRERQLRSWETRKANLAAAAAAAEA